MGRVIRDQKKMHNLRRVRSGDVETRNKIGIAPATKPPPACRYSLHLLIVEVNLFNRKVPNFNPLWAYENAVV